MKFTDIFIRRPVLATVISLLILIFGLRSIIELAVREYPETQSTVISITTVFPGADAQLVEGFITTPVQQTISSADGIDYVTAMSLDGVSLIQAFITLNFDPQEAMINIMSKVAEVRGELPRESEDPVVVSSADNDNPLMYISFNSTDMNPEQITDYVSRVVQPKVETIQGVAEAQLIGGSVFAMRIWLDPKKMAAHYVTPTDVSAALTSNNFQTAAGRTDGEFTAINIRADTDLHTAEEFANVIIRTNQGSPVRIKDVARVELGSENYDSSLTFNGQRAVFVGLTVTPTANPLTVMDDVHQILPSIINDLPPSMTATVVYDATDYIRESIREVYKTIAEAGLIVIVVIFIFLGSIRAVLIPVITIPLSLIGVCSLMLLLGYSINLLTLLAMVLAIGLVVDDAIVVVENIHRHIEEGRTPFEAAIEGAREIALPIVAMTITLAAVYAPIGFIGGLTGALFKEFAFTLAAAVVISGVVALTLSPMMCSKMLNKNISGNRYAEFVEEYFGKIINFYRRRLHSVLAYRSIVLVFSITVLLSTIFLYSYSQKETAPQEDQGFFLVRGQAPEYASLDYLERYNQQFYDIFDRIPEADNAFIINRMGLNGGVIAGVRLVPWGQRDRSQKAIAPMLQEELGDVAGLFSQAITRSSLPGAGGGGPPISFVLTSTSDYEVIYPLAEQLVEAAQNSGLFVFVRNSLNYNKPQIQIIVDRDKAADLGITMDNIGMALSTSMSEGYVNRFSMQSRSYRVIPQLEREYRLTPEQLEQIYIRTVSGEMVSLATIISLEFVAQPSERSQFQQLNSARIDGFMSPGYTIGDGLAFLEEKAHEILPDDVSYDFSGQSRQFVQENSALIIAFFLSIIVIFLVLAAQYESFRDPLIILISVPMSICGALIPINLGLATINIYTQVGLITLIGLISKHGILMVDFANHMQIEKGLSIREAIEEAAAVRLRPILMTTGAMAFGVIPLLFAAGAGAVSRFDIGLVIFSGLLIGTLFTLFVVPTMYTYIARRHQHVPSTG